MRLKDHFIKNVVDELDHLNGSEFESLCRPFIEMLTGTDFELKGHNLEMKPVRGSADLLQDDDYKIIGQCGTERNYFTSNKPLDDIDSGNKNCPNFKTIYLFCNRKAGGDDFDKTKKRVEEKLKQLKKGQKYKIFDGQRIARKIYENIYQTNKIEEILEYLPTAYQIYLLFPQNNVLPMLPADYETRPEEQQVADVLKQVDFLQIYGLSGIGKSLLSIAVANNLSSSYDTILWFDGNAIDPNNFHSINIQRLGESINLASILKMFKVLIVIDNLNTDVEELKMNFSSINKKGSNCIVTSLQKNVGNGNSIALNYVSEEISRKILMNSETPPSDSQMKALVKHIAGYPLLLELAKHAVNEKEMTWDDVINDARITEINDTQRNKEFAQRIIGRYKDRFADFFNLIINLDSTTISKLFLKEKSLIKLNSLFSFSILQDEGEYQCGIHQVVLSSVRTIMGNNVSNSDFEDYLFHYIQKHTDCRDSGLYTFMTLHQQKLLEFASGLNSSNQLRHYIVLACLYSVDTYLDYDSYLSLINDLHLTPQKNDVDLYLTIEKKEIEQNRVKNNKVEYEAKVLSDIDELNTLNLTSKKNDALRLHHIGKWLSAIGDYSQAEHYLFKTLEYSPKSFHSLLRLARNYHKQELWDKAAEKIVSIFNVETFHEVPISIRLSAYDIIGNNHYKNLRQEFIDNQLKQFSNDIFASLSNSYSQTYIVLAKYADHLSFNYPEFYSHLCAHLPLPMNIERNERLRKDYGKIKTAQYIYGNYEPKYKKKLFHIAEKYLLSVKNIDDYVRKDLIKLYLAAGLPQNTLSIADEFEKRDNMFIQQMLCKVYYGNGDYKKGLENIELAISQEDESQPQYCAAFRHDKAKCLYMLKESKAKEVMLEAIRLQPNSRLVTEWEAELLKW